MKADTIARNQERITQAMPRLLAGITDSYLDLDADELARAASTAPYHFRRIFRSLAGEPVQRRVRRLRLVLAAYRLVFGDRCVAAIGARAGYASHAAFTRAFRDNYGIPPVDLRRGTPSAGSWPCEGPGCSDVREEAFPRRKLAFVRYFGGWHGQDRAWRQLRACLRHCGVPDVDLSALAIAHDDPDYYLGARTRNDLGAIVPNDFRPSRQLGMQLLPDRPMLAISHTGPPEFVPFTYMHLAVCAVVRGHHHRAHPPLPYYVDYQGFPPEGPGAIGRAEVYLSPKE